MLEVLIKMLVGVIILFLGLCAFWSLMYSMEASDVKPPKYVEYVGMGVLLLVGISGLLAVCYVVGNLVLGG